MTLLELLSKQQDAIVARWYERVLDTYPAEAAQHLGQAKDPFTNPVGATFSRELPALYQALLGTGDPKRIAESIDGLVKLRAVQDFSPSQAMGFIFLLKAVIREELRETLHGPEMLEEWPAVGSRIDSLALSAFDAYAANRERMCDIRINAMRKRTFMLECIALGRADSGLGDPGR